MEKVIMFIFYTFITSIVSSQQLPVNFFSQDIDYETCSRVYPQYVQSESGAGCGYLYGISDALANKFIPSQNQQTIYIRLNLIFLQKNDGTGNFRENDVYENQLIADLISYVNNIFANWINPNSPTCLNGNSFISNTKIQFVVGSKSYVNDTYGWDNQNDLQYYKCPGTNWYLDYLDNQIVANQNISRGINVYFTENAQIYNKYVTQQSLDTIFTGDSYSCSQFPDFLNPNASSRVHMLNKFSVYNWKRYSIPKTKKVIKGWDHPDWENRVRATFISGTGTNLAHELGHSLGLSHSTSCETLMNPGGGAHNFLPPTEIGRVHACCSFTNLRSFIANDTYIETKSISSVESWYNMRLYQSLNITTLGQLTLSCNVKMPYQANIEVNGKLTVNNSTISSIGSTWGGIVVKSGGLLVLNSTVINDYNITVETGGTIQIIGSLELLGGHNIDVKNGAYICVQSGSNINLVDYNSIIKLEDGAIIGTNPSLSLSTNCISNPVSIVINGNGSIVDYSQDVYIQNQSISSNKYIGGKYIFVGNHVTASQTAGDVLINNGANVIFDCKNIVFDPGFECAFGSTYEVKNH